MAARLTFDVRVLEGDLSGADGPASVFVDIIGLPFHPAVGRRRGAPLGTPPRTGNGAAAAAAAPYYPPYGYPPPYYPYPPPY